MISFEDKMIPQRNATQRNATQRNATQRNATQRNALLKKRIPVSPKSSFSAEKFQIFLIISGTFFCFMEFSMKKFCAVFTLFTLFFFVGCRPNRIQLQQRVEADSLACEYATKANDVKVWENYLKNFPKGKCAFIAEAELEKHKAHRSSETPQNRKPNKTKKHSGPHKRSKSHR
jgi:hypothetical protein